MNLISLYQATATATGGRADGTVRTDDGAIVMRLGLPKELGGGGDAGEHLINPEQFFACAWAASRFGRAAIKCAVAICRR